MVDVHGVKSSSAGVGAMELSELAKELEMAGKEQRFDYIEANYHNFIVKAEDMINNIKKFFAEESINKKEKNIADMEQHTLDKHWIKAMVDACEDMDSQSIAKLIETLKDKKFNEDDSKKIKQMIEYANQYDYDEIIAVLQGEL